MNLAKKISIGITTTLTVATAITITAGASMLFTRSMNPHNLCTYIEFKSFSKNFDYRDQVSFSAVSDFIEHDSHGKLVANARTNSTGDIVYFYTYYKITDINYPEHIDSTALTNWDAVRKYLQIENQRKKAAQDGTNYNVYNR